WVNSTITLKEAHNMMDLGKDGQGRAALKNYLNKDGEKYQAWTKFDFTTIDKYGNFPTVKMPNFELEKKLESFNLKEMSDPASRKKLLESLEKGNAQSVTHDDGSKRHLYVNPQFKT